MPPRKGKGDGSRRVTRSQSKDINPHPPAEQRQQRQQRQQQPPPPASHDSNPPSSPKSSNPHPPRRNAPPARNKGQKVTAMGSLPPGPSSSATASYPGRSPSTTPMVYFRDMLLAKAWKLADHLADPKRDDEMWPAIARMLNQELDTTRERYLDGDDVFIDPEAIGTQIAREKTLDVAVSVMKAAYATNLATLLYTCNQFKSSNQLDILVDLLNPLDESFPSSFWEGGEDSVDLAIQIRYFRALVVIGEEIKAGRRGNALREQITGVFFGKKDEDIDSWIDSSASPRSFAGNQPDWEQVIEAVRKLVAMLEAPEAHDSVMQEISEFKLPLLDQLETWAREKINQLDRESEVKADATVAQPEPEPKQKKTQEPEAGEDESSDDSDSDSTGSPILLGPAILSAALRDSPPGSRSQSTQRDPTPPDYDDIDLSQIRASGTAAAGKKSRSSQRLSNIMEESEGTPLEGTDGGGRLFASRGNKRRLSAMTEDSEEDDFETDVRGPDPKRPRIAELPSGRRPLPGTRMSTTAVAESSPRSRKRRSRAEMQAKPPRSSHQANTSLASEADEEVEDIPFDLGAVRNENNEERRVKVRKPNVQHRTPWGREDEVKLIKAVGDHSARWSTISKQTEFETARDQQQVRDKARNMKVDFLLGDLPLPPGFDFVALGRKERMRVISMRKNPDRKVEDYDNDMDRVTNNLYVGEDD